MYVDRIYLAQGRDTWRTLVNTLFTTELISSTIRGLDYF
jgi:hypothetical protein